MKKNRLRLKHPSDEHALRTHTMTVSKYMAVGTRPPLKKNLFECEKVYCMPCNANVCVRNILGISTDLIYTYLQQYLPCFVELHC